MGVRNPSTTLVSTHTTKGDFKFNVVLVSRGKSGSTGIGRVIYNSKGKVLISFPIPIEIKDSKDAKVLTIFEALRM